MTETSFFFRSRWPSFLLSKRIKYPFLKTWLGEVEKKNYERLRNIEQLEMDFQEPTRSSQSTQSSTLEYFDENDLPDVQLFFFEKIVL